MVIRIIRLLGSVSFAIFLITCFAIAVIIGTVIESKTGSHKLASRLVYASPWFLILLMGFFVNILFASLKKYPYKRGHIPFLITHLGLLMILAGTLLKITQGYQGSVTVKEGMATDWMKLDDSWAISLRKKGSPEWQQIPLVRDTWGKLKTTYQLKDLSLDIRGFSPHGEEKFQTWIKNNQLTFRGLPPIPMDSLVQVGNHSVIAVRDPEKIKTELKKLPALVFLEDNAGKITTVEINEKGEIRQESYLPDQLSQLYAYDEGFLGYSAPLFLEEGELETPLSRKYAPVESPEKLEDERPLLSLKLKEKDKEDQVALLFGSALPTGVLGGDYLLRFEPQRLKLPVRIRVQEASALHYPNSNQVFSYTAKIYAGKVPQVLSMNEVWESPEGFRFYLANMTPLDESQVKEVRFVVNRDPYKYLLTYPGGVILALGIILLFTRPRCFRWP